MIEELITKLIWDILLLLITLGVGLFVAWLNKRLGTEGMTKAQAEWSNMQELALVAVRYAEQAYRNYGGSIKGSGVFVSRDGAVRFKNI